MSLARNYTSSEWNVLQKDVKNEILSKDWAEGHIQAYTLPSDDNPGYSKLNILYKEGHEPEGAVTFENMKQCFGENLTTLSVGELMALSHEKLDNASRPRADQYKSLCQRISVS